MSIAEFIRESVLRPRLKQAGALVVYDPDKRYREQCFDLAGDKVRVVDTSESSIESREAALLAVMAIDRGAGIAAGSMQLDGVGQTQRIRAGGRAARRRRQRGPGH